MTTSRDSVTDLALYTRAARSSSARVIRSYSTSFGLASRLLPAACRAEVESVYGLVRVADEIVDGAAREAGLDDDGLRALLDGLERETEQACARGYSANVVVHAFADTARRCGIDGRLTAPFFASMRRDLDPAPLTEAEIADYIYGSAEVVGLMCLRAFLRDEAVTPERAATLEAGARQLGAAFQKVNFLRDLGTDWRELGRNYLPGTDPDHFTEADKHAYLDEIDAHLAAAATAIPQLPAGCRPAIAAAHALFGELSSRLRRTPADRLVHHRVRVSTPRKLVLLARSRFATRAVA